MSLLVTFKSFPVYVYFFIQDKNGEYIIVNKLQNGLHVHVELGNVELQNIKSSVKDNNKLFDWCRNFSIAHSNFLDKEKLKNEVFEYENADTVEFLEAVFSVYNVCISIGGANDAEDVQINSYVAFLNYIDDVKLQLKYPYLLICFYANEDVKNKLIKDNYEIFNDAYNNKDIIINGIINVCEEYYENIKKSPIQENYSNNVSDELTERIDNFFTQNSYDKSNLTGMHSVNESLNIEIECIKSDYVKKCNEVIEIKLNEFNKMKAEKEKTKKNESKTTTKPTNTSTTTTSPIITTTTAKPTASSGTEDTDHLGGSNDSVNGNKSGKTNTSNGCRISCRKNIN